MRMQLESPAYGLVSLAGYSLHTPGWQCVNSYLLMDRAPFRRNNKIRPGVPGAKGKRGYPDEITVELEVSIIGDWNRLGLENPDANAGEEENYHYLVDALRNSARDDEDAVHAIVTSARPGVSYQGPVQIGRIYREPIQETSCCFIEVTMIRGELEILGV